MKAAGIQAINSLGIFYLIGQILFQFHYLGRVSISKTFAQFMWNETQNFSFFAHQFCAKKQQFHSQKLLRAKLPYSAIAKLKFCAILQLEFCAIPQFRKNQRLVTVCVS